MKILIWTNGFKPFVGGLETFSANLALGLKARGHEVLLITFQQNLRHPSYEEWRDIPVYRFISRQLHGDKNQLATCKKIFDLIKKFSPDIFHLQFTSSFNLIYYLLLASKIKAPIVVTPHGLLDEQLQVYRIIVKQAARIVCVSKYLLDQSNKILPEMTSKSSFIHNAMTISVGNYTKPSFKPVKLLCLGRLTSEKGYDIAIRSFSKVLVNCPDVELYLVGDGPEKKNLSLLVNTLNIQHRVHFVSSLCHEDSLNSIKEFSIVLIPSRYESFGMVAIEAGMMGRPVVSMAVGGLSEIVLDGITGRLVNPEDIDGFSAAIISLIENPSLVCDMGKYAYSYIRKNFSLERMVSSYEELYQESSLGLVS